jgi:hypothetical protein
MKRYFLNPVVLILSDHISAKSWNVLTPEHMDHFYPQPVYDNEFNFFIALRRQLISKGKWRYKPLMSAEFLWPEHAAVFPGLCNTNVGQHLIQWYVRSFAWPKVQWVMYWACLFITLTWCCFVGCSFNSWWLAFWVCLYTNCSLHRFNMSVCYPVIHGAMNACGSSYIFGKLSRSGYWRQLLILVSHLEEIFCYFSMHQMNKWWQTCVTVQICL